MSTIEAGPSTRRLRPIAPMPAPAVAVAANTSDRSMRVRLPAVPFRSVAATNSGPVSSHQNRRASTRITARPVDTIPNHSDSKASSMQTPTSASSASATYSRRKRSRSSSVMGLPSLLQSLGTEMNGLSERLVPDSRESTPLSSASSAPATSPSTVRRVALSDRKGKAKASGTTAAPRQPKSAAVGPEKPKAEKRILPARIRRAAGGGAEGIRDLEEMIVDWLERWGEPVGSPPESLALHLITLPLSLIDPPPRLFGSLPSEPFPPVTTMPTDSGKVQLEPAQPIIEAKARIEVPSWVYVKAGEDDQEEAKDELQTLNMKNARGSLSPVKRLRHATAEAPMEDTSDAYYIALHKKCEVFERRQRIREKEKLQFERYKLRSRIDLLKGMSKTSWSAVVSVVLSRSVLNIGSGNEECEDRWAKGREKLGREGVDWLRDTLVKEGEELMKRFDQLLPPEHRKPRPIDSRTPTPMTSPSLSPPPVIPHRVAALRDAHTLPKKTPSSTTHRSLPKRITLTLKASSASTPTRSQAKLKAPATEPTGRGREKRKRADLGEVDDAPQQRAESRLSTSSRRMRSQTGNTGMEDRPPATKERRASLRSQTELADNTTRDASESSRRVIRSSVRAAGASARTTEAPNLNLPLSQQGSLDTLVSPEGIAPHHTMSSDMGSKPRWDEYALDAELSPEEARELREVEAVVL